MRVGTFLLSSTLLAVSLAMAGCADDAEESADEGAMEPRETMETRCNDGLQDCETVPGDDPHEGADRTYTGG